jgi:hypothetical protein
MSINLDKLLQDNKDLVNKEIIIETKTTSTPKEPKLDFDAIVTEWSYRCDKGYPDMKSKSDMIKLQEILDEMGIKSPFKRIEEKKLPKTHKIFNPVHINKVYPKHGKAIMDAYRQHGPQSDLLNTFGTAKSLEELLSIITAGISDPLYKALYTISSVSGGEGEEADTSGRGGLGKGEVLCVLLTQGGKSGGDKGTDLSSEDGKVEAEVKAGKSTNFKIPFVAKRVARLTTLSKLDDLYSICKTVMSAAPKSWDKFMADRNESVDKQMEIKSDGNSKMTSFLFNSGYAPSNGNINGTELANYRLFFEACHELYYGNSVDVDNEDLYIDVDTPSGDDMLLRGKLSSPKDLKKIDQGGKVSFSVTTSKSSNSRVFQQFENKLREHPYVVKTANFDKDMRTDCKVLLGNFVYIIFKEKTKGVLAAPFKMIPGSKDVKITGFTLGSVAISTGAVK